MKRKVNYGKLSLEFKSIRIATHKEGPALKHGQTHVEKWIPPFRGLFNKSPEDRHAKREFRALKNQQGWTYKII